MAAEGSKAPDAGAPFDLESHRPALEAAFQSWLGENSYVVFDGGSGDVVSLFIGLAKTIENS